MCAESGSLVTLKKFDADDSTSDDYPDTADRHASEEGQEERRQIATHDRDALSQFVNPFKACELLDREMFDGVPGIKVVPLGSHAAVSGGSAGRTVCRRRLMAAGDG